MFSSWRMENYLTRKLEELKMDKTNLWWGKSSWVKRVRSEAGRKLTAILDIEGERKEEM